MNHSSGTYVHVICMLGCTFAEGLSCLQLHLQSPSFSHPRGLDCSRNIASGTWIAQIQCGPEC